jgi:hypothetical protein
MITLRLSHKENEKCGLKKYVKVVSKLKLKLKNKASLIEEFTTKVH